ncbi:MAG: hypothetical protein ABSE43_18590 [Steroidobacteraceae bacterium]|jgi:hypothetical protein
MRTEQITAVIALSLAAGLAACTSTSPARLCDSPLVRVNALAPAGNDTATHGGGDHE